MNFFEKAPCDLAFSDKSLTENLKEILKAKTKFHSLIHHVRNDFNEIRKQQLKKGLGINDLYPLKVQLDSSKSNYFVLMQMWENSLDELEYKTKEIENLKTNDDFRNNDLQRPLLPNPLDKIGTEELSTQNLREQAQEITLLKMKYNKSLTKQNMLINDIKILEHKYKNLEENLFLDINELLSQLHSQISNLSAHCKNLEGKIIETQLAKSKAYLEERLALKEIDKLMPSIRENIIVQSKMKKEYTYSEKQKLKEIKKQIFKKKQDYLNVKNNLLFLEKQKEHLRQELDTNINKLEEMKKYIEKKSALQNFIISVEKDVNNLKNTISKLEFEIIKQPGNKIHCQSLFSKNLNLKDKIDACKLQLQHEGKRRKDVFKEIESSKLKLRFLDLNTHQENEEFLRKKKTLLFELNTIQTDFFRTINDFKNAFDLSNDEFSEIIEEQKDVIEKIKLEIHSLNNGFKSKISNLKINYEKQREINEDLQMIHDNLKSVYIDSQLKLSLKI